MLGITTARYRAANGSVRWRYDSELGRVATDDRIAPRSENLSSPMTRHRRRALRSHDSEGFARPQQLERAISLTRRMDSRTHRMSVRAAIDSEGQGHRPVALEACKTSRARRPRKLKVLVSGTANLEIPPT